jgi:hypothetical protein
MTTNPLLTSEGSEKNPSGGFSSAVGVRASGLNEFCYFNLLVGSPITRSSRHVFVGMLSAYVGG